jgi:hypothetical protein
MTVDASPREMLTVLRASNHEGRYIPDLRTEVASWMPPNVTVRFTRFNEGALRRFWQFYRQDSTYNLTNRSCSVVVSLALDMALMGALEDKRPCLAMLRLFLDREFWAASVIRREAKKLVWTPGLVMDYAIAMQRLLEKHRAA